jgi:aspartate carbamoyltransferase catalytic subunit
MPARLSSLLDLKTFTKNDIEELFSFALELKQKPRPTRQKGESVILGFFEASTRTRLSFETAAIRAGLGALVFDGGLKTSLEKGETIEDSLYNMAAMDPQVLVVRCADTVDLPKLAPKLKVPVLNAGWGVQGHPTQALLDQLTLKAKWKSLEGKKLLIIGDLKHSRVAASHLELAAVTGLQLAQVGPENFQLPGSSKIKSFSNLAEALKWADAAMALRFQFERHEAAIAFSKEDYRQQFGLNLESLKNLKADGFIMHPGPINHGIEMETEVLTDSRAIVLDQVRHGVYLREAVLRMTLGESL